MLRGGYEGVRYARSLGGLSRIGQITQCESDSMNDFKGASLENAESVSHTDSVHRRSA